jgi:hypothetical protein
LQPTRHQATEAQMKILIIIAFALVIIAILSRELSILRPGSFLIDILAIVALSSLFIIFGYRSIWTWSLQRVIPAYQSRNWPSVEGRITHSSIREEITGKAGRPPTRTYYPEIKYLYNVNGERFEGHNLLYEQEGPPVFQRESVARELELLKVGQTVKVFYDSQNPASSCLRPGFYENPLAHVLMNLFGVFLLTAGLLGLWRGARLAHQKLRRKSFA